MRTDAEEFPIAWDSLRKSIQQLPYSKGNHVTPPSCTVSLPQEQLTLCNTLSTHSETWHGSLHPSIPHTALGVMCPYRTYNSVSCESSPLAYNIAGWTRVNEPPLLPTQLVKTRVQPSAAPVCRQFNGGICLPNHKENPDREPRFSRLMGWWDWLLESPFYVPSSTSCCPLRDVSFHLDSSVDLHWWECRGPSPGL